MFIYGDGIFIGLTASVTMRNTSVVFTGALLVDLFSPVSDLGSTWTMGGFVVVPHF